MIPYDKLAHAAIGPWCAFAGVILARWLLPGQEQALAALGVALAALGREAWNLARGGEFSWPDVIATLTGGAPVVAVAGV